jgi:hypothetical protein
MSPEERQSEAERIQGTARASVGSDRRRRKPPSKLDLRWSASSHTERLDLSLPTAREARPAPSIVSQSMD